MDVNSKTDPFCVMYEIKGNIKTKIGQTECILDNLNPEFVNEIEVNYKFEENQAFVIEVYDADDMTQLDRLDKQEYIGGNNFTLHQIITSRNQTQSYPVTNIQTKRQSGEVKIHGVEKKAGYG